MREQKPLSTYLGIAAFLLTITFYGKVQHLSDPNYERLAYILFGVLYMIRFSLKTKHRVKDYAKVLAITFWCIVNLRLNLYYYVWHVFVDICLLSGLIWFISEIVDIIQGSIKANDLLFNAGALLISFEFFGRINGGLVGISVAHLFATMILSFGFFRESYLQRKSTQA